MNELLKQLGVNWKLLLSQGVNFLILMIVMTIFVYKPLLRLLAERQQKIEKGLKGAEEAERLLKEVDKINAQKIAETEKSAVAIIKAAEEEAQKRTHHLILEAHKKAQLILQEAEKIAEKQKIQALEQLSHQAKLLVKKAIIKTVELNPDLIDEKLIEQAINKIKNEIRS